MSNYAWSCNVDGENDWYFVNQMPLITPFDAKDFGKTSQLAHQFQASYTHNRLSSKYYKETDFNLGTIAPVNTPNGALNYEQFDVVADWTQIVLEQPLPATTKSSKTYTSGVDWNLSGTVGYDEATGPSTSVSGGMTVSNSVSTTVPDVTVKNKSASPLYNNTYNFDYTTTQAKSTFQTTNSFIFHMPTKLRSKDDRGNAFDLFLSTNSTLALIINPLLVFQVSFNAQYALSLPLPPLPTAQG